jgi:cytochrome b561
MSFGGEETTARRLPQPPCDANVERTPTPMSDAPNRHYDGTTIALHWLTAILVVALWIIGQTGDWPPRGPMQDDYWSIHVVLGFVLTLVLACRILWRIFQGRRLPPADSGLLYFLARTMHYALYLTLLVVVGLGVVNAFVRGYELFGLVHLPQIGDAQWRRPITHWHGLGANLLLILAFLHASAALLHYYVVKDWTLQRMFPGPR